MKWRKGSRMSTAHSLTFPSLHLRHSSFTLILQSFRRFTYVTAPSRSFSNLSVTSPTSQLILQPIRRFTFVTAHSPTLPLLHICHSSFSNPSFASPTSQALHLIHLASRPWFPSTSPSIWICNFEVIPHISIKVRRWLKGCIPVVLGNQNESEQIFKSVRFQTSTLYSTQTVRFRTRIPS